MDGVGRGLGYTIQINPIFDGFCVKVESEIYSHLRICGKGRGWVIFRRTARGDTVSPGPAMPNPVAQPPGVR